MMALVRNEQTKLTATLFNGVAIASIAVGFIAPVTAAVLGTTSFAVASIAGGLWLAFATGLHIGARLILRRLVE